MFPVWEYVAFLYDLDKYIQNFIFQILCFIYLAFYLYMWFSLQPE